MKIIENEVEFSLPHTGPLCCFNKRQRIIGSSIFFYVPSYRNVVERKIVGFRYYESLAGCRWRQYPGGQGFHDPSLPSDDKWDVNEGSLLLRLSSPHLVPTRITTMNVDSDGFTVWAYSAGKNVEFIYSTERAAVKDHFDAGYSMRSITPCKDGLLNSQRRMLAEVA